MCGLCMISLCFQMYIVQLFSNQEMENIIFIDGGGNSVLVKLGYTNTLLTIDLDKY